MENNEDGAVDVTGMEVPTNTVDPMEREERQDSKKNAKKANKELFVICPKLKCDGKTYLMGDKFEGKIYDDMNENLRTKKEIKAHYPNVACKLI